jgi:hypothetical protein
VRTTVSPRPHYRHRLRSHKGLQLDRDTLNCEEALYNVKSFLLSFFVVKTKQALGFLVEAVVLFLA